MKYLFINIFINILFNILNTIYKYLFISKYKQWLYIICTADFILSL